MGVLDPAVHDAELVQAPDPCPQLITVVAGERNMIEAGAVLVESVTCGPGVGMQAEQLPSTEREHGVVKAPRLLVLVQDRPGAQQLAVPVALSGICPASRLRVWATMVAVRSMVTASSFSARHSRPRIRPLSARPLSARPMARRPLRSTAASAAAFWARSVSSSAQARRTDYLCRKSSNNLSK
jgi:hypothetical protein